MAIILGNGGNNIINGGAANDLILAGGGNDAVNGGDGNDIILAGAGADTADGGSGSDIVFGEAGNDVLIYRAAENAGVTDIYDGGSGIDRIRLVLTRNEWLNPLLQQDIAAYLQFLAAHTSANGQADGAQFQFSAFDLRVSRMETLEITVDGMVIDPADQAVVAQNDAVATNEDSASAAINLLANDSVPDLVRNIAIIQGPTKGSYKFDADLSDVANPIALLTYTPDAALQSLAEGETATDTIVYQVTDADGDVQTATATITIHGVNDAPVLGGVAATATYTENGEPTLLSPNISLADVDSATAVGATVKITSGFIPSGPCILRFDATGTQIQGSYNSQTGVLSLTGIDSIANYQSVLASVSLEASGENPTNFGQNPTRTIEWQVDDGSGFDSLSKVQTTVVTIEAVNDAPVLGGVEAAATYTENAQPTLLSPNISLADVDSQTLMGATVKITSGFIPGSPCLLRFTEIGDITGIYDPQTRTLQLTGLDTVANYQAVLASVTFDNPSDNPTNFGQNPTRTIEWQVDDGSGFDNLSKVATTVVTIEAVNDAPTLAVEATATYTENGQPTLLSPNISLADVDSATAVGATVKITSGFIPSGPCILRFDATGTQIQGSYNSQTGVLSLTGIDSIANYQSVLASVSLEASGENPTNFGQNPTRTIEWQVDDGLALSKIATTTVSIQAVNDPPAASGGAAAESEDTARRITPAELLDKARDPDSITLTVVDLTASSGTLVDNLDGTWNFNPAPNDDTAVTFSYLISDGALSTPAIFTLDLIPVSDTPLAVDDDGTTDTAFRMTEDETSKTFNVRANDTLDPDPGAPNNVTLGLTSVQSNTLGIDAADLDVIVDGSNDVQVQLHGTDWLGLAAEQTLDVTIPYSLHGDQPGDIASANLIVRVGGLNSLPISAGGSGTTDEEVALHAERLEDASDADAGDKVTFTLAADASHGKAVVNPDGSFVYTPDPDFFGSDLFKFSVSDDYGGSNTYTFNVTVNPVNDAPVADNDSYLTAVGKALHVDAAKGVLIGDSDIDSFQFVAALKDAPAHGQLALSPDGSFDYVPEAGFIGIDSFTYVANDGEADSNIATVTIDVVTPQDFIII